MVLCASHTKSLKNVDFYSPHRHTLGVPPSCLLTTCGSVAQLRITSTLDIWRFQCGDGSRLQTILWLQTQWFFQCTWTFSTVLRKMGRTNQRPTSCQEGEILSCIIHELHPFLWYRRIPRKFTKMSLWILNTISSASTNNTWSRHYITVTQQRRKKAS